MIQFRHFGTIFFGLLLVTALALPGAGRAATKDKGTFDIYLRGIRAAVLSFSGVEEKGRYAAAGRLESAGIVGFLVKVRYDASSSGRIKGERYVPSRYSEKANTGRRVSESVMQYRAGVPQVKTYKPERKEEPGDVKPSTQGGTIDPMTAIYAALRDVPRSEVCTLNVKMFDGRRRSQITYSDPVAEGEGFTCKAEYRRLKGFTDKEMAERTRFPFTVTYVPVGDGEYRVTKITMVTLYGNAVMNRR